MTFLHGFNSDILELVSGSVHLSMTLKSKGVVVEFQNSLYCRRASRPWHKSYSASEGRPDGVLGGKTSEGNCQEAFSVHWLSNNALCKCSFDETR